MVVGDIINDSKQFYEGQKRFWRTGQAINLLFFECRNKLGKTYIKITAINCSDTSAIATPLFLNTDKLRITVENSAAVALPNESKSLKAQKMSGSAHPPHHSYIGLNKYTLDLLAKFLFDRVIVSIPKISSTAAEFGIELMHLKGDNIASNGKLDFEIVESDVIVPDASPVIVSENIAAFEKKTASFVESKEVCHSTYQIARNHSIACLKSIRNFNIMKISDNRRNLPSVRNSKTRTRKSKDARFGSLIDSFVEQGSEFLNSVRISGRSGREEESYRYQRSYREMKSYSKDIGDGNIGISEELNGVMLVKEVVIEGSTGTNVVALPALNRRISTNYVIHKIEEVIDDRSLTMINSEAQFEQSGMELLVPARSDSGFIFYLPKLSPKGTSSKLSNSKLSKDPKSPQTVGSK
jgi:hypothetical protein